MTTYPFEHSPLDPADPRAIQILDLLPSPTLKGPLCCELHHSSLDKGVQYEAVSYTWGQPEPAYTVFINGPYALDVTPNCLEVLMSLRRRFHRRRLWIDAICIDQRDNDRSKRERDRQVSIMGDIFHKAQKVLVWLGSAEPSTARTIAMLKFINMVNAARISVRSSRLEDLEKYLCNKMVERDNSGFTTQPQYQAFASMMCSPWWQRVWTMQEQALARHCEAHHGRQSLPLHLLGVYQQGFQIWISDLGQNYYNYTTRDYVQRYCFRHKPFYDDVFARYLGQPNNELTVRRLLEMAFLMKAKNHVDKIYGLYSILTAYCELPLPAPDYNKKAEDVYEETVWAWVKSRRDLNILKLAARPGLVDNLPSWVPAWHQQHPGFIRNVESSFLETFFLGQTSHFNWNNSRDRSLSEPSLYNYRYSVSIARIISPGKLIVLHARCVGRVSHAIGPDRSHEPKWHWQCTESLHMHLDWCNRVHDIFFHNGTKREKLLHEMFRSLLRPGIHQFTLSDEKCLEEFDSFRAWFDFLLRPEEDFASPSEAADADSSGEPGMNLYRDVCWAAQEGQAADVLASRYKGSKQGRDGLMKLARHIRSINKLLVYVRNHRLCILDNDNIIAVTDYWCQEGDEVFVFPGTDSPFVLRKQPDGGCYRLVGPALVDRLLRVGYQKWRSEGNDLQNIVLI